MEKLKNLGSLQIRKHFKPDKSGDIVTVEFHHFSNASIVGYDLCSCLRLIDDQHQVHYSPVMAQFEVAAIKLVTIPCLEITDALVLAKINFTLPEELAITKIT
jgi:hypothetical protein